MLLDWMSRPLSFLLLFHLPSSHNVFPHILYFSLSFFHIPSFFDIYVCLSIRNFWSPIHISFLHVFHVFFLLFSFFLLIFSPSQPLSSSSLLFYLLHCLLFFLPPFLSFTTFYPSFSSSFQNPSPPSHPSWIHILAINNGSENEQADKTYRKIVFFNDMLKYYHIYGMWTEYDIIHQIHQYYLE